MYLSRAHIKNFRSIKEETVSFDPPCRTLVGINESGKTNILDVLSKLSEDFEPDKKIDVREPLPKEQPISESFVKFYFIFTKDEMDELFDEVSTKILSGVNDPVILRTIDKKNKKVKSVCKLQSEAIYGVDFLNETRKARYWEVKGTILSGWERVSKTCPPDFKVQIDEEEFILSEYVLVRTADIETDIPEGYLEKASKSDLESIIGDATKDITENALPDVTFWEYDEENLLPAEVDISTFVADVNSCVPLKNMFTLAGHTNIASDISGARDRGKNQFQNFLDSVAEKTTKHFRNIWKEYKDIKFSLRADGNNIVPGVKEKNTHDFAKRSDGFKRFVTFLLFISVDVRTDKMVNSLLLIDEPDSGLHPSGARYLRDELIKISAKNKVLFSTHSIFMIDPGNISRHYIVKKKDEITSIEVAKDSNISDEEVLFNALGFSVFEFLKEKNIIFEGWKDKKLFIVGLTEGSAQVKKVFKDVGLCHAKGCKHIKTITPMIELAQRRCVIVSDSDNPALEQKKLYERIKGYGDWCTYADIDPTITAITGEDFLQNVFIIKCLNGLKKELALPNLTKLTLPDKTKKLETIQEWLRSEGGFSKEQIKISIDMIKNILFEKITPMSIDLDEYKKLLMKLSKKI